MSRSVVSATASSIPSSDGSCPTRIFAIAPAGQAMLWLSRTCWKRHQQKFAPWYLIPANDKPFGRIAAFRIIADRLGKGVSLKPRPTPDRERSLGCPVCPQTSNNIIQKGLAFVREQSGSVTVSGRDALGILPRRLQGRGGAAVVAANDAASTQWRISMAKLTDTQLVILSTASRRNDRGVDLPGNVRVEAVRNAWISSSALGCWRRSAPMARSWAGDAMLKLDPWRFASPSRASKRWGSRMLRWALLRKQALVRPPT